MKLQRVVVDLDPSLVEEAKNLVSEGRRAARRDWPESLSELANAALNREIESLRSQVRRVVNRGRARRD
ncbi:MAG: hypothetical protein U1A78_33460 [Polyangia bacterium]